MVMYQLHAWFNRMKVSSNHPLQEFTKAHHLHTSSIHLCGQALFGFYPRFLEGFLGFVKVKRKRLGLE